MTGRRVGAALLLAIFFLAVCPADAAAWSPGTHVYLADSVLFTLLRLPAAVADLLRAFPYDFLYGNIAADTSIAKKYAPVGRHCHSWNVAKEIAQAADTDRLHSFALGYLSHLAADTVAHNFFVPRQLVVTSRTIALGHSYWESRFDMRLGQTYARAALEIIRLDHSGADAHLDRILTPTIFSVSTGRRLFRGMVGVAETQSWQRAFRILADKSRWDLRADVVDRHMAVAFELMMEVLSGPAGRAWRLDPSGESSLHLAKRMRLDVIKSRLPGDKRALAQLARQHFGLPHWNLPYWDAAAPERPWHGGRRARPGRVRAWLGRRQLLLE